MLVGTIKAFIGNDSGATAIEYGLIAALIAVAAIGSFMAFGNGVANLMGGGAGTAADIMANQTAKIP